ncbi:cysteine desulfurase [Candidatus Woesearchaeota archaeon]|nr:cysteine desulfurase [Candidatus Woesearchaeota archaeon]
MFKTLYFDNGATTKVDSRVVEAMLPFFEKTFGNPSSAHSVGHSAKDALDEARNTIAQSINASSSEIVFTSGGTESNNAAIKGVAFAWEKKGKHIIVSAVEHKCILASCEWLKERGFRITYLPVNDEGFVSTEKLEKAICKDTILVSIIHGNNEVGTINDLEAIGTICHKYKILFHSDACQSFTKVPIDVKKMNMDLLTINSHKIHGPRGVGALFIRKDVKIDPLLHGGGQEHHLRSGTENVAGVVGFAKAVSLAKEKHNRTMTKYRDKIISKLLEIDGAHLNGPKGEKRLCNNINLRFDGVDTSGLGGYLDRKGIETSSGSACSAPNNEASYVLQALGLSAQEAQESIRITLSRFTTEEEVDKLLATIPKIIAKCRKKGVVERLFKN